MGQRVRELMRSFGLPDEDYLILQEFAARTGKSVDELLNGFVDLLFAERPGSKIRGAGNSSREIALRRWFGYWRKSRDRALVDPQFAAGCLCAGLIGQLEQLYLKNYMFGFDQAQAKRVYGAFRRAVYAAVIQELHERAGPP